MFGFYFALALNIAIMVYGFYQGRPLRLTHGVNWEGYVCGQENKCQAGEPGCVGGIYSGVVDKPFMAFCGSPGRQGFYPKYIIEGSTVCTDKCPHTNAAADQQTWACLMPAYHNFTSYKNGKLPVQGGASLVDNVETLEMTLTQSVTNQLSYPTQEYGGRFCMPSDNHPGGTELRKVIMNGPWGAYYRPLVSLGSLEHAWPLLLCSGGLALILGLVFYSLLQRCAGMVIFISMVGATILTCAAALVFLFCLLKDMNDTNDFYFKFNPITSVYTGTEATVYSCVTGVVLLLLTVVFGAMTANSLAAIDESVGLIDACIDCICESRPDDPPYISMGQKPYSRGCGLRLLFPLCTVLMYLASFVVFGVGLFYVGSVGDRDRSEISINGNDLQGLQRVFKKQWWEQWALWYYIAFMYFLYECIVQVSHFNLAYIVSCWYFTEVTEEKVDASPALAKQMGGKGVKQTMVRIGELPDGNAGLRPAAIYGGGGGQKFLVAQVGKKGPGLGRNDLVQFKYTKKDAPSIWNGIPGMLSVLVYHMGSITKGAPLIAVMRIFRMPAQCIQGFLFRIQDEGKGQAFSPDAHTNNLKGCLSLMSACIDHVFGRFSKTAFTHLVLCGGGEDGWQGFTESAEASFSFLIKAGGSIAHLYGSLGLYELFGSLAIALFSTWVSWFISVADCFHEINAGPNGMNWQLEDRMATLLACFALAFIIGFSFMSVWSQTGDVLLYCLAWNRRQRHEGEEHRLAKGKIIGEVDDYAGDCLRFLIPPYERGAEFEHGLHAHGLGQQGAILAAMEHGAMNAQGSSAPDYTKAAGASMVTMNRMYYG
jgi:hypothetical protein